MKGLKTNEKAKDLLCTKKYISICIFSKCRANMLSTYIFEIERKRT